MIDALSALSLYRQLEGLEEVLKNGEVNVRSQWMAAYMKQSSFNHIPDQITESNALTLQSTVEAFFIYNEQTSQQGPNRSAYPRFLAQVTMLKRAIGALLEQPVPEQKSRMGF
jgi:hypothetical protein